MGRIAALWNRAWWGKAIIALGGFVIVCCVLSALVGRGRSTPTASAPTAALAQAAAVTQPTTAPEATAAPAAAPVPTDAPAATEEPTSAPEPTAAPSAPSLASVGDRVEANGMALTVVKVDQVKKVGSFQKADAGNVFVLAEVIIENVSADESPYNPLYFKVKDGEGFEYNAGISTADRSLKSGKLSKGDKARGTVLFEVKEGATGLVLEYKPIVLFSGDEAIKIKLN